MPDFFGAYICFFWVYIVSFTFFLLGGCCSVSGAARLACACEVDDHADCALDADGANSNTSSLIVNR